MRYLPEWHGIPEVCIIRLNRTQEDSTADGYGCGIVHGDGRRFLASSLSKDECSIQRDTKRDLT